MSYCVDYVSKQIISSDDVSASGCVAVCLRWPVSGERRSHIRIYTTTTIFVVNVDSVVHKLQIVENG